MKITQKQYYGYKKAKREMVGISFNDAYNMSAYGITRNTFYRINNAVKEVTYNEDYTTATLIKINKVLKQT